VAAQHRNAEFRQPGAEQPLKRLLRQDRGGRRLEIRAGRKEQAGEMPTEAARRAVGPGAARRAVGGCRALAGEGGEPVAVLGRFGLDPLP
jgi:hypothetical protein